MRARLHHINKSYLHAMKVAVKGVDTWDKVALDATLAIERPYSASHINDVMNGHARPSYELAVFLVKRANQNIRRSKESATWQKKFRDGKVVINAQNFTLRNCPFVCYEGTTHRYFERTPGVSLINSQ